MGELVVDGPTVAVVLPAYRVRSKILSVISEIGPETSLIYVVDDGCPEQSGLHVQSSVADPRVLVLFHDENQGVGGATLTGFDKAVADGADIIVKVDGDGQMDPVLIPHFVEAIVSGEADYAKGNRFFDPEGVSAMPLVRLIGNVGLSFITKFSTGYWHTFDPTNGFFAIHSAVYKLLPTKKIARRYFFESDLLFRLNLIGAKVVDIPMSARYEDEHSGLKPGREIVRFALAHLRNFTKRIGYNYFLRSFSVASIELVFGLVLFTFGVGFGLAHWRSSEPATAGTVMIAALPIIVGTQLLLSFLNFDFQSVPRYPMHRRLNSDLKARESDPSARQNNPHEELDPLA